MERKMERKRRLVERKHYSERGGRGGGGGCREAGNIMVTTAI